MLRNSQKKRKKKKQEKKNNALKKNNVLLMAGSGKAAFQSFFSVNKKDYKTEDIMLASMQKSKPKGTNAREHLAP